MKSGKPPVRIAHAYGNSRQELQRALEAAVDVIEADVWFRAGDIRVRHERRLGALPLVIDRRMIGHTSGPPALPLWKDYFIRLDVHPLRLRELLDRARGRRRLMLDVKGEYRSPQLEAFARALIEQVSERSSPEEVIVCGQSWPVLDAVRGLAPNLEVRYSIEKLYQWEVFLLMIADGDGPRLINMEHRFMTEDKARFLEKQGIEVYCWTVDDPSEAERLVAEGVDGIISNNLSLLASLRGPP